MIEPPHITHTDACQTAVIHLTIPRSEIQAVMGPGIGELMSALKAQGLAPAGPVFSHHLVMSAEQFDFELGVPVSKPVTASGRVHASSLPAARVARTVFHGNYDGLGKAWHEFMAWIETEGLRRTPDLWEVYVKGPESSSDPADWRTELNQPLLG